MESPGGLNEVIIVCGRLDETPHPWPGSIEEDCDDCGVRVWISASGQEIKEDKGAVPVCLTCAISRRAERPDVIMPPTEAQKRELRWAEVLNG